MASLTRVNFVAQQRLDLQHLLAAESYTAFDFRALTTAFTGEKPFILRGFEVIGKTGLAITIGVKESLTFNPLDGNGSFYKGLSDDDDVIIELPAQQENLFIEAKFINITENPVNTAQWDPLALTGEDVAGTEFSASINSQVSMKLVISANSVGFTVGAIPILRASTDGSNVTKMVDCRPLLYRLGSGGVTPNPANRYAWGTKRREPVPVGVGVDDEVNSPFMSKDLSGALNDKALGTFKDWADAMMTRICEITGSSLWYASDVAPNDPTHGYITGLDLQRIFLDSEGGHSIQPNDNVTIKWTRKDPLQPISLSNPLILVGEGADGLDDISVVQWQANYGSVRWELGGEFISNIPGGSRQYKTRPYTTPDRVFESPVPSMANGGNMYLLLERDVTPPLSSGNAVKWADNSSFTIAPDATTVISGVTGDFTGIAIGDWVRKASEGFSQYYQVVQFSDGRNTLGDVADSSVVAIVVDRTIATGASIEEMMYFRSRYCQTDLVVDDVAGVYDYKDSNYYWLGRRVGDEFLFRGFGNMSEGEEVLVKDDSSSASGSSAENLLLVHPKDAVYSSTVGYSIRGGATGITLLTIRKRKRDNLVYTGAGSDNTGGFIDYTINAPVGTMIDGDGLWVRLSDTNGGVLSNGSVTIAENDYQNLDTLTNRWEVRSVANNVLRTFDNKDVHLIARKITLSDGSTPALHFIDGTVIDVYGRVVDQYVHFQQDIRAKKDVYLNTKTPKSILFIDQTPEPLDGDPTSGNGRIDEDNDSFSYDKDGQEQTTFNNVYGWEYHRLRTAEDQHWFQNLGDHTLTIGDSNSTIQIPGNLTVIGSQTIIGVQNIVSSDRLHTIGVGNPNYGGGGSGLEIADNTLKALTVQTYAGLSYIDITPESDPLYALGQKVGVVSNAEIDEITSSDISNVYTVVASASAAGEMESIGGGVYRIWTRGTGFAGVTNTYTVLNSPIQSFDILSNIKLSGSDSSEGAMTSWKFGIKRYPNSASTLNAVVTPYESADQIQDFVTVPTARQSNFSRTRIPYAWKDGVGAAGSDTTFDFTDRLTWDFDTNTFRIEGTLLMRGHIIPQDDNLWDIGSTTKRWRTIHVGPGSFVTHKDDTNTNWGVFGFSGNDAVVYSDAATDLKMFVGSHKQIQLRTDGRIAFGDDATNDVGAFFTVGTPTIIAPSTDQKAMLIDSILGGSLSNAGLLIRNSLDATASVDYNAVSVKDAILSGLPPYTQAALRISDLTVGIRNMGVVGEITSGLDKWFIYGQGNANNFLQGSLGIGNNNQTMLNTHRLVVGIDTDTTTAGGMLIGGDVELYRSAANYLKTDDNLIVALTTKLTQQSVIGNGSLNSSAFLTLDGIVPDTDTVMYGVDAKFKGGQTHVATIEAFLARPATADFSSPTTVYDMVDFHAVSPTKGSLATVRNMTGLLIDDFVAVGVGELSRVGIKSLMAIGANKWDLYLQGGASSYISGSVGIGNASQSSIESFRLLLGTTADTTANKGMSFGTDVTLYRSGVDTLKTDDDFVIAKSAYIGEFANFTSYLDPNSPAVPTGDDIRVFTLNGETWQKTSDGNIKALTNEQGNVYEEEVDVVASPVGNNQMAAILANPLGTPIALPQDRTFLVGNSLAAKTVAAGSGLVRISKNNHGLSTGNIVKTTTSTAIDGINGTQLSGSFAINVIDTNTFEIATTGSATTGNVIGYITRTTTTKMRKFLVGHQELEMYLNDVLQRRGVHWDEVGNYNTQSNIVRIYREINLKDRITWRIDSNGGQTMIGAGGSGGSGGTLQSAYDGGSIVVISTGAPITLSGTGTLLASNADIQTTRLITSGVKLLTQSSSPIETGSYGLWADSVGNLMYRQGSVDITVIKDFARNIILEGLQNGSGSVLTYATPVCSGSGGTLQKVDVSNLLLASASFGLVYDVSISAGSIGSVMTHGRLENVTGSFTFGDVMYVDKSGALSNVRPSVGVGGFILGDSVVRVGVIVRNRSNPVLMDLAVSVVHVGTL